MLLSDLLPKMLKELLCFWQMGWIIGGNSDLQEEMSTGTGKRWLNIKDLLMITLRND
jgi:hypothetical protein